MSPRVVDSPPRDLARPEASSVPRSNGSNIARGTPTLLLVRHGETQPGSSSGENKIMQGWSKNDITERGRSEVAMAGSKLARLPNIGRVISSDLPRSTTSGSIVADKIGAKSETDRNLRPWNIGNLAGKKIRDIKDE